MRKELELEYEISLDDLIAFNHYHVNSSQTFKSSYRKSLFGVPVYLFVIICVILYIVGCNLTGLATGAPIVILAVLWFLLYPKYYNHAVIKSYRKMLSENCNNGMLGKQKVLFQSNKLVEITEKSKTEYDGKFLNKIVETDAYLYLYLTSITAIIIPKRIFFMCKLFQ